MSDENTRAENGEVVYYTPFTGVAVVKFSRGRVGNIPLAGIVGGASRPPVPGDKIQADIRDGRDGIIVLAARYLT